MKTKLFVIGDSISIHYGPDLKDFVGSRMDYKRKGASGGEVVDIDKGDAVNGGDSSQVLTYLKSGVEPVLDSDVLLLNCGLHDVKTDPKSGRHQVPEELYRENLRAIFEFLRYRAGLLTVWVRTTHVDDVIHNARVKEFQRFNRDVDLYNKIADEELEAVGFPVVDLNAFTRKLEPGVFADHVHFVPEVRKLQAAFIAGNLFGLLAGKGKPS